METFSSDWLALREPVDARSRASDLVSLVTERWGRAADVRVVDLAAGAGTNLRFLAPRLDRRQHWTLVDHDGDLLSRVRPVTGVASLRVVVTDLADPGSLDASLDGPDGPPDLVTGSAWLDLVSADWMDGLVETCVRRGCPVLFALTYDGRLSWTRRGAGLDDPQLGETDRLVRDAVNAHQRRDKGLGPALGPAASDALRDRFAAAGYEVQERSTPWRLSAADAPLVRALVDGWCEAAGEVAPAAAAEIVTWGERRRRQVAAGELEATVGHRDVLAWPGA